MNLTRGQAKSHAIRAVRFAARVRVIRNASRDGLGIEVAAQLAGMKITGVRALLYREFGSTNWPIA